MRQAFCPEWLIDGTGSAALPDYAVVVDDGIVRVVLPRAQLPADRDIEIVEFAGATLAPGLINNHVHLVLPGDNTPFVPWIDTQSDAALALRAAANAARSLRAGITTVRDCGARGTTVLDLAAAQRAGLIGGAAAVACGWPITIAGGHTRQFGGEADGEDALRRMVRRLVSLGADFIKVMAAGGGTPGSLPQYPSFSLRELQVVVEAAHDLGRKVAMHCIATASIDRAVAAGADAIEHASFYGPDLIPRYDPATAERLAQSGIPVTPTLQVARDQIDLGEDVPDAALWRRRREAQLDIVARLRALGVPILAGSDAGWRATAFETFWKEFEELVAAGLTPVEAVRAGTGATAEALGLEQTVGTIQPGRRADLLVVDGELSRDIGCLRCVRAVYHAGKAVGLDRDPRIATIDQASAAPANHGLTPERLAELAPSLGALLGDLRELERLPGIDEAEPMPAFAAWEA
ncbi:MAG TPA: amidohydrolase family protein [Thermomicrobiales bacterium]|nr:amidohydrolase family protein [Thermomicrobiales bacterium]